MTRRGRARQERQESTKSCYKIHLLSNRIECVYYQARYCFQAVAFVPVALVLLHTGKKSPRVFALLAVPARAEDIV